MLWHDKDVKVTATLPDVATENADVSKKNDIALKASVVAVPIGIDAGKPVVITVSYS